MKLSCIECGKEFYPNNGRQKCCSKECQKEHAKKVRKINDSKTVEHTCESCGSIFMGLKRRTICDECLQKLRASNTIEYEKPDYELVCKTCGCNFISKNKNSEYCSSKCYQKARYLNVTKKKEYTCICEICGNTFISNRKTATRCSNCKYVKTERQIEASKKSYWKMLKVIGTDNPSYLEGAQEKRETTCLQNNGVKFPFQKKEFVLKAEETKLKKFGYKYASQNPEIMNMIVEKIKKTNESKGFGYVTNAELPWVKEVSSQKSKINMEIGKMLEEKGHTVQYEYMMINKEGENLYGDMLVNGNIIIEYDPWNTHNTEYVVANKNFHRLTEKEKESKKNNQLKKTICSEENGYRCIHIFSWDNIDKIFDMINTNKRKIYARECDIIFFTNKTNPQKYKEISDLIEEVHLQGQLGTKNGIEVVCIALEYKGEIVSVMTFGPERNKKQSEAREIYRLCTKKGNLVVGGANKMWNCFIKTIQPNCVISFCDKAHFSGKVYYELGMKLQHTYKPRRTRCLGGTKEIRTQYENIYKEYTGDESFEFNWKELGRQCKYISDNYINGSGQRWFMGFDRATKGLIGYWGKGTKNIDLIKLAGYVPVYDCGQMKFVWYPSNKK